MNCKVYLLLNLCDVLMLRAEYSDAQAVRFQFFVPFRLIDTDPAVSASST